MEEGSKLQEQGQYDEAEKAYSTAIAEAENVGLDDQRLAMSLNALAMAAGFFTKTMISRATSCWWRTSADEQTKCSVS
jgi:hypothetical protein